MKRFPPQYKLLDEHKVHEFLKKVEEMAAGEFGRDEDGDPRLEVMLVDRSRFNKMHFVPVPYAHSMVTDEQREDFMRAVAINASHAQEWVDRYFRRAEADLREKHAKTKV